MGIDKLATSLATRRGSLALGSAALLGLSQRPGAEAKKKKSCSKKSKKKVNKACGAQVDECTAFFAPFCAAAPNPAQCQATADLCCAPLGDCDFTGYTTCVASQLQP
jgi:hypothetical protein